MIETHAPKSEKVVIQFGNRTVKGYLESPIWNTIEELLANAPPTVPETFHIRNLDTDLLQEGAVFFFRYKIKNHGLYLFLFLKSYSE